MFRLPELAKTKAKQLPQLRVVVALALLIVPQVVFGHPADDALSQLPRGAIASLYLKLGFTHIVPLGLDHILFVVCLYLLNPRLKSILWQATAFTIAHSITLGLSMYGVIQPPAAIIEPIIALSIFFVAVENILTDQLKPSRLLIVFVFGLIHGMGFAGVLTELGLPRKEFITALITFNVGVELGQIAVILALWAAIGYWFARKPWYRKRIVNPLSIVIAVIALYWMVERTFFAN